MSWWRYIRERRHLARTLRILRKRHRYAIRNGLSYAAGDAQRDIERVEGQLAELDAEYASTRDA